MNVGGASKSLRAGQSWEDCQLPVTQEQSWKALCREIGLEILVLDHIAMAWVHLLETQLLLSPHQQPWASLHHL